MTPCLLPPRKKEPLETYPIIIPFCLNQFLVRHLGMATVQWLTHLQSMWSLQTSQLEELQQGDHSRPLDLMIIYFLPSQARSSMLYEAVFIQRLSGNPAPPRSCPNVPSSGCASHQSAGMFVFLEFAWPALAAKSSLGPCGFHLWFGKHNMFKRYWWEKESPKKLSWYSKYLARTSYLFFNQHETI